MTLPVIAVFARERVRGGDRLTLRRTVEADVPRGSLIRAAALAMADTAPTPEMRIALHEAEERAAGSGRYGRR